MTTSLGKLFGTFLGIEFKDDTLVISYLRNNMSGISLLSSSTFPLKNDDSVFAEIREYISRKDKIPDKVYVSIPDKWVITKFIEMPSVRSKGKDAFSNLMRFEIERHIPFNIEEVSVDFLVLDTKVATCSVAFIAVHKVKMDYVREYLEKLSLKADVIIPSSFAVLNTIELSGVSAGGFQEVVGIVRRSKVIGKKGVANVCLYFDKLHASLSVIKDGLCIHQRLFSFPSAQACQDGIAEYLAELCLRFSVDRFDTLILSGDISSAVDNVNALKEKLGINVMTLDEVSNFSKRIDSTEINVLAPSVGACFAGLELATYTFNLLPHRMDYKTGKLFPLSTRIFLVLILVLIVGIFTAEAVKKKKHLANIETELQKNKPMIAAVEKLSTNINELENQINLLRTLRSNEETLEILAELSAILPKDAWISNFEYKTYDIKDKKEGVGGLVIRGYASSASALIPILEASPYFEKLAFSGPIKKAGDKEQFRLTAEVVVPAKKAEEVDSDDMEQGGKIQTEENVQKDQAKPDDKALNDEGKTKVERKKRRKEPKK